MCSGLEFCEDYVDERVSDVMTMLFGAGQEDMAAFAAAYPLAHEPGTVFNYSSGTTNILSRIVGDLYGGRRGVEALLADRLFGPLGMTSAVAKFDPAGTFVGSSYVYATARDFARFGGVVPARRIGRRATGVAGWLGDLRHDRVDGLLRARRAALRCPLVAVPSGPGSFAAQGYQGQRTLVVPDLDLVVVRLGITPVALKANLDRWLTALVDALRQA